jgi:uncharacterized membrane protein
LVARWCAAVVSESINLPFGTGAANPALAWLWQYEGMTAVQLSPSAPSTVRMNDHLVFLVARLRERLWVRPLAACIISVVGVFLARLADGTGLGQHVADISRDSIESLLQIVAASMLVIATFAVASMVSAYASASSSATPRSFPLILADDISQNALSTFIGSFIYAVVALVALMNGYYDRAGRFTLFVLTVAVFAIVIVTFVRWVDRIARLGRLGSTIDKVEEAAAASLGRRKVAPFLGGSQARSTTSDAVPLFPRTIGYLQLVDMAALQTAATEAGITITLTALPGAFCTPDQPLAQWSGLSATATEKMQADLPKRLHDAFVIGGNRQFEQGPRFGFVVLSEIASRALSPAVNDPGTAIDIIGTIVRLFHDWALPVEDTPEVKHDRVRVPALATCDLFDDAFTGIARDGAGTVEVMVRLQKALRSIGAMGDGSMRADALRHSDLAMRRAALAMQFDADIAVVRTAATTVLRAT